MDILSNAAFTGNEDSELNNEIQQVNSTSFSIDSRVSKDIKNPFATNETILPNLTLLGNASDKTEITDETDFLMISNAEFMAGIYGDLTSTERPVVVSFPGNPVTVHKSSWHGNAWNPDTTQLPGNYNNYTTVAAYRPDDKGKYSCPEKFCPLIKPK